MQGDKQILLADQGPALERNGEDGEVGKEKDREWDGQDICVTCVNDNPKELTTEGEVDGYMLHHPEMSHQEIDQIQRQNTDKIEAEHTRRISTRTAQDTAKDKRKTENEAARIIQRNIRSKNDTQGNQGNVAPSPEERWMEAIKAAKYKNMADPKKDFPKGHSKWTKATYMARQLQVEESSSSDEDVVPDDNDVKGQKRKRIRDELRDERLADAKVMDQRYWLEMVDMKHRYGSNLCRYHLHWQSTNNKDNFFNWLDNGEGRNIDLPECAHERLDSERVRYLSREERARYLVRVNEEGLLIWAKNGELVDTSKFYTDSEDGIVPLNEEEDLRKNGKRTDQMDDQSTISSQYSGSDTNEYSADEDEQADKYVNVGNSEPASQISPTAIMNRLLKKTTRSNTWIFASDTRYRLYIGIKQSGAFQHSSFLHGARLAAAGLIKVKKGHLASLSPLSGHYRCTTKHFRNFVKSLRAKNVNMNHVSISRSYTILAGLEVWGRVMKGKKKVKAVGKDLRINLKGSEDFHHEDPQYDCEKEQNYEDDKRQTENVSVSNSLERLHIQGIDGDPHSQPAVRNNARSHRLTHDLAIPKEVISAV